MRCLKYLVLFWLLFVTDFAFSEEKLADEATVMVKKDYSGKQSLEWERKQASVGAVKARLDVQIYVVQGLIADKEQLTGKNLADKMDELKKEHAKLQKIIAEYNQMSLDFKTKFPERGIKESRVYKRIKPKSLLEYEQEHTIQGRANRLHAKILKQYSKTNINEKIKNKSGEPAQKTNSKNPKNIDEKEVTDPIFFKK